jgi:hypothetical protein
MHITRSCTLSCLALVVLAALSGQAFAGTYYVKCKSHLGYATIQSAVTAVQNLPGTNVIDICPGNYPEQVVISPTNSNTVKLTLQGIAVATPAPARDAAVIVSPLSGVAANTTDVCPALYSAYCTTGAPIAAQILIQTTSVPVVIANLTVDGSGNQLPVCSSTDLMGILFQNASGTVDHVAVRNQVTGDTVNGCQTGKGIYVESSTGTSVVTVESSSVHNYSKNGITGRYPGTTLTATGNYVQGSGVQLNPTGGAQNGIEIAFGATGTIKTNTVIDNLYEDPTTATASDILLYDAAESSGIEVASNILGNSQIPVALETDLLYPSENGNTVAVTGNKIFGTGAYDAIDVCTNNNTVTGNTIFNSAESGVHLDAGCGGTGNGNAVTGNTILESACAGILKDPGTSNANPTGTYYTVPFTVTSSTSSCTIPEFGGAGVRAGAKTSRRVNPAP